MDQTTQTTPPPAPASSAGKGLGIAGLVLGILAAIISFIPCLGTWAIVPGIIAIILSAISLSQASKAGASKGLAIAGLVCGIVGTAIAGWQWYVLSSGAMQAADILKDSGLMDSLNKAMENSGMLDSLNQAMEEMKDIADSANNH
jgi:hypothetical protein